MNPLDKLQVAVLGCLLITLGACDSSQPGGDKVASASSPSTATAKPAVQATASADPRADVVQAMRGSLEAKSYRSRMVTSSSNGHDRNMSAEVVAPDRMHMTMTMQMPGRGAMTSERIIIGKQSYVRAGKAPWQKDPMDMGDMLSQFRDPKLIDAIAQKSEVKFLGADTLDGAPMLTYQYTIRDLLGPGKDGVSRIWIGATDHLQHQVKTISDFDPLNTGKIIHSETTVTFYDYNADIRIDPPI